MTLPGTPSLVFLFYLLVFLPWAAMRSARRLREARREGRPPVSRTIIWTSTLVSLVVLLILSVLVGRTFNYEFIALPGLTVVHFVYAAIALAVCLGLRQVNRMIRSEEERRAMEVYAWAPRAPREWTLWLVTVLVASVAEEVAYRGVGMAILWYTLGNGWIAALISAIAFALAHTTQGWKSAAVIFAIAAVMHGLVALTGTVLLAIVVHAAYDLIAGYSIARTARAYDAAG